MGYELTDRKRTLIFINLIVSGIASSILSTAMTTALPSLVEYFGVSTASGQWVTSGYSLAMGMVMPLTAYLITKFPTRKLYISGISVFLVGLFLSLLASNFPVMMAGRVLQACGNGVLLSTAQVTILTIYPKEKKGTMMGTYGLATTAAPVIAPTIAGLMIDAFGWKSIFYLVLVVMLVSLVMACMVFENVLELQNKKFDTLSFVESIFAFGGVTLGIGNVSSYGLVSLETMIPLLVGIVGCICFAHRQFSLETPFLDLKILKNRQYATSVVASMVLYFTMMGSSVLMPLYVQTVMGRSAVTSGLVTLPGSLATALISPIAGKLFDKMGIRKIFILGSICLVLSNVCMCFINMDTPLVVASLFNIVRNVSIGALMMPLLTWGTSSVEPKKVADASSLLTSFRTVAGSIGSAVFVGIMVSVGNNSTQKYGDSALMHGLNVAFATMALSALLLTVIAIFGTSEKSNGSFPKNTLVNE
jgi:EmrB/QacA subfamily drug resistance transporter